VEAGSGGSPAATVKPLNCPQCGAALTLRAAGQSVTIVCPQCLAILDAKDPTLQILQKFTERTRVSPRIPLGTRGRLHGDVYEAIGFQVRTITVEGIDYSWSEYLLFNPYQGFRYLTEYDGHWNDVKPLKSIPRRTTSRGQDAAVVLGQTFRHFQKARARTTYVLGEFPWRVRVGDTATVEDFVAPPLMVSAETEADETTWSLGEYVSGARVWEAFQLPGSPPPAIGVYANQPSPTGESAGELWQLYLYFLAALVLAAIGFWTFDRQEEVFHDTYYYSRQPGGDPSFVTEVFELKGRPSNVELSIHAELSNSWMYFAFALINEATGQAYDFGREVSYYSGTDSDGSWSEGSKDDRVWIPTIPAGRYYLRIEPEADPGLRGASYQVRLRRDVPVAAFFVFAVVALGLPPALGAWRAVSFESARWRESDTQVDQEDNDTQEDD
jgi:uncharacterized protein DUF4178